MIIQKAIPTSHWAKSRGQVEGSNTSKQVVCDPWTKYGCVRSCLYIKSKC